MSEPITDSAKAVMAVMDSKPTDDKCTEAAQLICERFDGQKLGYYEHAGDISAIIRRVVAEPLEGRIDMLTATAKRRFSTIQDASSLVGQAHQELIHEQNRGM